VQQAPQPRVTPHSGAPKLVLGHFDERAPRPVPYRDDPDVVRVIESLPANTSAILPNYKIRGKDFEKWRSRFRGGPYTRDYGTKMVYAPDRDTALYAGGNHGSPHVFNDAWEYHLRSNSWNLLFPPDGGDHGTFTHSLHAAETGKNVQKNVAFLRRWFSENVRLRDGTLQTTHGGPIFPRHTWDGLTYDRRTGRMLWAVLGDGSGFLEPYARYTGQDAEILRRRLRPGSNMWMFDPDVGHWIRQMGPGIMPTMRGKGGFLEYIPDLGKSVWFIAEWNDDEGMWAYDGIDNSWTRLATNNRSNFYHWRNGPQPQPEMQVAYSAKHKKLVAVRGTKVHVFDLLTNEWSLALDDPAVFAHDAHTVFVYDPGNDVFLLAHAAKKTLKAYSLTTNRWTDLTPRGAGFFPNITASGYFDERDGLLVMSGNGASVWVYRYGAE